MQYIYNITFVVDKAHRSTLVELLINEFKPSVTDNSHCKFVHLTRVAHELASADFVEEGQAESVAMQFAFPDQESMISWQADSMTEAYLSLEKAFGHELLHFDTVLEVLDM